MTRATIQRRVAALETNGAFDEQALQMIVRADDETVDAAMLRVFGDTPRRRNVIVLTQADANL